MRSCETQEPIEPAGVFVKAESRKSEDIIWGPASEAAERDENGHSLNPVATCNIDVGHTLLSAGVGSICPASLATLRARRCSIS